jgi:hypothetical protein
MARHPRQRPSAAPPPEEERTGLVEALVRPDIATPLAIGIALCSSSALQVPSGGVLPTVGAILIGISAGRALDRGRRRGMMLIGLGIGIALGARFTRWSQLTDLLFGLGGAIVAIQGIGQRRRARRARRQDG